MNNPSHSSEASMHLEWLQAAIIEYLDGLESLDAKVFEYNGTSIRSVVEKKLYFKHLKAQINPSRKPVNYRSYFGEEVHNSTGVKLRLLGRKVKALAIKNEVPAIVGVETMAYVSSKKHELYLDGILKNERHRVRKLSFQPLDGPHLNISKYSSSFQPDQTKSSTYLFENHFDLLVEYELFKKVFAHSSAKSLVFLEGNSPQDNLAALCAKQVGIQTICIQHGWACNIHLAFKNLCVDTFIGWGAKFTDLLKPHSPKTEFLNLGHPHLIQHLEANQRLDRSISVIMQGVVGAIDQAAFDAFNASLFTLIDQGWHLLIREHPSHPIGDRLKQELKRNGAQIVDKNLALRDQLQQSQYTYTIHSSVGFEALLSGNVVIFGWYNLNVNFYPEINKDGMAFIIKDQPSLIELLEELESDMGRKRLKVVNCIKDNIEDYFASSNTESRSQILDYIFSD
ncbi:MAG: hypothetical protein Salg2KO_14660 [Salibacteraceae bacterium]